MTITITKESGCKLVVGPSSRLEEPAILEGLDSGPTWISQAAISPKGDVAILAPRPPATTSGSCSQSPLAEAEETCEILGDPDTMGLLATADDDFKHGREIRGKLFPKKRI